MGRRTAECKCTDIIWWTIWGHLQVILEAFLPYLFTFDCGRAALCFFFSWSATVVCHAIMQAENEFLRLGVGKMFGVFYQIFSNRISCTLNG